MSSSSCGKKRLEPFACDKFVGTSTVDHITHCVNTLLVGLGTTAAGPEVRLSRYEIEGYRTLTLLFRKFNST